MGNEVRTNEAAGAVSRRIAEFVVGLGDQPPPAAVLARMRLHVLDTFGCQLAFATLPWSRDIWAYVRARDTAGPSTVAFYGAKVAPELAAFANAAFTHGFEMDDTDMASTSHPGTVVVSSALALGQQLSASGREFLTAVAAGYEIMIRVALGGVGMTDRGYHSTSVTGPFGAAAAAAVLEGLDVDVTTHALAICASRAGGVSEFAVSGGTEKRLHGAYGAQMGLESVGLARAGVTAPVRAIEGERGLLRAVTDTPAPDLITAGLGQDFLGASTGIKLHCCCGGQHSVLDAVSDLVSANDIRPEQIARIAVRQNPREFDAVGLIRRPQDVISSQFSVAFGIGLRLVAGANGFRDYIEARLDDPRILEVADKVVCERLAPEARLDGDGPCEVDIALVNGDVHAAYVSHPRGSSRFPVDEDHVVQKFRALAGDVLGEARADRIIEMVANLDALPDVGLLAEQLVPRDDYRPADHSRLFSGTR
ncbi:hypothetical protein GCM10012320_18030 [Sinomonas cellulolyticus]|uniref:MmgE/PrpD family protein n=1 Tax=Sinomonas cellulolyticus TaxID=2801916 RepID=A0ABS1K6P2_9MICC|nr:MULTISPECIES: MmgE/PrpD family protein [Sinomonas]MBL0707184.1 MmgE/PrpD family protein [Sinomonas cellulolyticus]GHG49917.1 hypothetical protein GCM10012320_18030 [Sinomonas sp. KCTC 49339]